MDDGSKSMGYRLGFSSIRHRGVFRVGGYVSARIIRKNANNQQRNATEESVPCGVEPDYFVRFLTMYFLVRRCLPLEETHSHHGAELNLGTWPAVVGNSVYAYISGLEERSDVEGEVSNLVHDAKHSSGYCSLLYFRLCIRSGRFFDAILQGLDFCLSDDQHVVIPKLGLFLRFHFASDLEKITPGSKRPFKYAYKRAANFVYLKTLRGCLCWGF